MREINIIDVHVIDLRTITVDLRLLDDKSTTRAESYRCAPDRARFIARRIAINEIAPGTTWLCSTCGGRDHGVPSHPTRSISTAGSDDVLVVATGPLQLHIGVDVIARFTQHESKVASTFAINDLERSIPAEDLWLRKEAVGKALGRGIADGDVDTTDGWWFRELQMPDGYRSLVASDHEVELRGFEPLAFSLRTRRATNCATAP